MTTAAQPAPVFSPTDSQLAVAYSVCRAITRAAARNFYYAFLVLPRRKRQALCAVYAFMRRCDDITDDPTLPVAERLARLSTWVEAFHRVQAGAPTDDPVMLALADAQRRYQIPLELLDQLAHGTAMDLQENDLQENDLQENDLQENDGPENDGPENHRPGRDLPQSGLAHPAIRIRYRSFDDLYVYCYRVASVVGLVCIRIFGYRDPAAEPLAERTGIAFQLTNILRDVKEDAEMGRVYLPEEDMAKFGLSGVELRTASDASRWRPLLALEAGRAREFYRSADELLPLIDEDGQPALWVLVTIYRTLLEKIALRNFDVFTGKVRLTTPEKLWILGKGLLRRLT